MRAQKLEPPVHVLVELYATFAENPRGLGDVIALALQPLRPEDRSVVEWLFKRSRWLALPSRGANHARAVRPALAVLLDQVRGEPRSA
ncbi:MAG TPA: hypothetical protein VGO62_09690, partial [Myxococcota bacterium]